MHIYLARQGKTFDFARFHSYPPNEMFFSIAGLDTTEARIAAEYPEHRYDLGSAPNSARFNFDEVRAVSGELEHFSIHSSGRVHLKYRQRARPKVIHDEGRLPGAESCFLELHLISDSLESYSHPVSEVEENNAIADVADGGQLLVVGVFGGPDFDAQGHLGSMAAGKRGAWPGVALENANIKGALLLEAGPFQDFPKRPRGTIVAFRWFAPASVVDAAFHVV